MGPRWKTIEHFTQVGSTGKVRGTSGELKLFVDDAYVSAVSESEFLFLESDGIKVPLAVESIRMIRDVLVKFRNVNDPAAAARWSSTGVFLPGSPDTDTGVDPQDDLIYADQVGFRIVDKHLGEIGEISAIESYPQQEMALVVYCGKDVMIPLNPAFIVQVDTQNKILQTDLPDGLLDI